jgi:NADH dehydrogenase FAD-containing subunit
VVIIGGFGGLWALERCVMKTFRHLIDRRNLSLSATALPGATGALSPSEIAAPLRVLPTPSEEHRGPLADAVDLDPTTQVIQSAHCRMIPGSSPPARQFLRERRRGHRTGAQPRKTPPVSATRFSCVCR